MENRKYTVVVKPTAIHRLASHVEFLARVSEEAASFLLDEYDESIVFLESYPESCPPYIPKLPIDAKLRYKLFSEFDLNPYSNAHTLPPPCPP